MIDQSLITGGEIANANRFNHAIMVFPDTLEIDHVSIDVQADCLIHIPVGFQQAGDKGIVEAAVDEQVQVAMFSVGDLRRGAV